MRKTGTSPYAGKAFVLRSTHRGLNGQVFECEGWFHEIARSSWLDVEGNPAVMHYAFSREMRGLPIDNKVLYGHVNGAGWCAHQSELGLPVAPMDRGGEAACR